MSVRQAVAEALADAQVVKPGEVVFYAWTDAGNQSVPSSVRVRISGGERYHDPTTGKISTVGNYNEIQFLMGMHRTTDPEVIKVLRGMIKKGDTITEDKEVYLSFVEPAERRSQRLAMKASQLTTELESKDAVLRKKDAEIERLNRILKGKSEAA